MSEVNPLFKEGDLEIANNSRPVMLFLVALKVCERVAMNHLTWGDGCDETNICSLLDLLKAFDRLNLKTLAGLLVMLLWNGLEAIC